MKANVWLVAAAMSVSGLALAQAPKPTVREVTDPAKIAEIERHAEELGSRSSGASGASGVSGAPVMDEQGGMKPHAKHPHKHKPKHKRAKKEKAPTEAPMATENKG